MVRIETPKEETVPAYTHTRITLEYKCDKCGKELDYNHESTNEDEYSNELMVFLNADECVNSRIRFDLCTSCLLPIWDKICLALGIDPDDEHRIPEDWD